MPTIAEMYEFQPIENHAIVGDLHTIALVALDATIDFMCFPRFDSPSIFASLLDADKGGHFQLSPLLDGARRKQFYLPDSNILLTRFLAPEGVAEISDFMTIGLGKPAHNLVRRVKTIRGDFTYRIECRPRFDYGRAEHKCELTDDGVLFTSTGTDSIALRLRSRIPLKLENGAAVATFKLEAGHSAAFVLEDGKVASRTNCGRYIAESFKSTMNYWRDWISHCRYKGRWREIVNRSALTLKLLVSQEFGSLVAAPTFGLPEVIGGERNWD